MSLDGNPITRRGFVAALALGLCMAWAPMALAKDDNSGGNSGSGGGKDDDGGGADSGGDDSGGDDDKDSDRGDDRDGDKDSGKDDGKKDDSKKIREAVRSGEAVPLKLILAEVRRKYPGQVVRVRLTGSGTGLSYSIRILDVSDRLIEVKVNARTKQMTLVKGLY